MTTFNNYNDYTEVLAKVALSKYTDRISGIPHNHPSHVGSGGLFVGKKGIDSLPGIAYLCEHSSIAGSNVPKMVLSTEEGSNADLWLEEEMRHLLYGASFRRNRAESARNICVTKLSQLISDVKNEDKSDKERQDSYEEIIKLTIYANAVLRNEGGNLEGTEDDAALQEFFKDALAEVDASFNELPPDLPKAIQVLLSRLEAAANTNLKRILNAVTQQGMDLPASCFDQETAVTEIGAIKQKYQLQIETATTIDEAKGYFDDAVKDLDNVTPLNTPEWSQYDANTHLEIGFNKDLEYEFVSDTPVVIAARHPQTPEGNNLIDGLVSVTITEGNRRYAEQNVIITSDRTHIRTEMRLIPPDKGLRPRMWRFTARNLCGPSKSICVSIRRETENE